MQEAGKYWSKCEAQRKKNRKERVSFPLLYVKFTFLFIWGRGGGGGIKTAYNLVVLWAPVFKLSLFQMKS